MIPARAGFSSTCSTNQSSSRIPLGSWVSRMRSTSAMVMPSGIHDGLTGISRFRYWQVRSLISSGTAPGSIR